MKIAFLAPEYPHEKTGNSGGIGTSIKNLALGILNQGSKVVVLVYGQKKDTIFFDGDIEVHQIKNVKFKGLSWYLTRKKIERVINNLYKNKLIDVVEAPDWTGITSFIKPKKCPIIIKLHGSDTYFCHLDNRKVKFISKFHEKRALKNANAHISVSKYVAEQTNELFNQSIKYKVIHNGVDVNNFKNTSNCEDFMILYLGTLIRKKGLLELPLIFNEVVKQIPQAKLILVGGDSGDIKTGSKSTWQLMQPLFSNEASKQVNYIGKVPYNQVKSIISNTTICVFPSFAEAFPVSWLEAMAMKKAVVASNIGWGPELIKNKINGILVNPKNHIEYAESIILLLKEEENRINIQNNARLAIETDFDINAIAKQNIEFYKSIIK